MDGSQVHVQVGVDHARQYCAEDFKRYIKYRAEKRRHVVPDVHYIIADFLQGMRPGWRRRKKLLQGFRLLAKTTLLIEYVGWRWMRVPWTQVIWHCSTNPLAGDATEAILSLLREDPLLQHLAPVGKVGVRAFNLRGVRQQKGPCVRSAGITTSLTSSRCDLYIFDDPEPDDEPEAMRERVLKAFAEANEILQKPDHLFPDLVIPNPEITQMIVTGQPHTEQTAYERQDWETEHPLDDAVVLRVPAVNTRTGDWVWPQRFYSAELGRVITPAERTAGMPRRKWFLEFLLDTKHAQIGRLLHLKEIKLRKARLDHPVMWVDPADGQEGCEWGLVVCGMADAFMHLAYMGGLRGEVYEGDAGDDESLGESVWAHIFDLCDEFEVRELYLEVNFKGAREAVHRYMRKANRWLGVREYRATRNKLRRIVDATEPVINNGMVTADPSVMRDQRNVSQLNGLRGDGLPKPCDRLDALSAAIEHFIERGVLRVGRLQPGDPGVPRPFTLSLAPGPVPGPVSEADPLRSRTGISTTPWQRVSQ